MKKIPPGAEASNVLVGEVDFLEKPIIAFVRLSPAVLITGLTEVPVPTRYKTLLYTLQEHSSTLRSPLVIVCFSHSKVSFPAFGSSWERAPVP